MVALAYPSPYRAAMSSLGFQTVYRLVQQSGRFAAARVFAPDDPIRFGEGAPDLSYETGEPIRSFRVVAFSVAYELELGSMLGMLSRGGVPALREERDDTMPLVIAGGPLTFSNPLLLAPFADAILVGEADGLVTDLFAAAFESESKQRRLESLAQVPSVWVPALHGDRVPEAASCSDGDLPAWGPIRTPHAELRDMFLVEAVRGCSRRCQYCVMRGRPGRGMRIVAAERILELVPEGADRVGLVGASVSDHPAIVHVVQTLASRGCHVGLSSLRPERLKKPFVEALRAGGYKTVTTAMDGASQRLRDQVERRTTAEHLLDATRVCREAKVERLKLYLMVGLPGETLEDLDECAALVRELSRLLPVSLGVSPFCAKRGTPLEDAPFAGTDVVDRHIKHLRKKIAGRVEIRAMSARWAWVEHVLAGGGEAEGRAVLDAERAGGKFAHYRKALEALGHAPLARKRERA
jgi:radical SAM superfamily enzyme YgiQ (UPF0313 family)